MLASSEEGISLAFVVGVFLSNFPEAMSSSIQMAKQMSKYVRYLYLKRLNSSKFYIRFKVFLMWASLCVLTGLGAAFGAIIFQSPGSNMLLFNMAIEGSHFLFDFSILNI